MKQFLVMFYTFLKAQRANYTIPVRSLLQNISPIFNEQLFHTKVNYADLLCQSNYFWRKEIGMKAALKILVKLTPGVNPTFPSTNRYFSVFDF